MLTPQSKSLAWCAAVPIVFFIYACCRLGDVGVSWDEDTQRTYGQLILDFYASQRTDTRVLHYVNLYLYGGFFDVFTGLLERVFITTPWYVLRHFCTLSFATLGVFFTARLAALIANPRAGFLAALLLVLTPRFFGHALFNPKDIPFAALYIISVYVLVLITQELPRVRVRLWIAFALASGLCLGVRIGGLLLFCYLGAALGLWALTQVRRREQRVPMLELAGASLITVIAAVAIATTFWPFLQSNPPARLMQVLAENSQFRWNFPVLFQGVVRFGPSIGRVYLPLWLWISTPPVLLAGLLLSPLARVWNRALAIVVLAALFPPLYAIAQSSALYDGIRQFLFIFPALAVIAALGWNTLITHFPKVGVALLVLALAEPALWIVRSHPYEYTYFSPLGGGLARVEPWGYGAYDHQSEKLSCARRRKMISRSLPRVRKRNPLDMLN